MYITVGCDPEVFVRNKKTKQYVSAHGLVPGTKRDPFPVPQGAIQVDGMALEFNTEPCGDAKTFYNIVSNVLRSLKVRLNEKNPDLEVSLTPSVVFDRDIFDAAPDEAKMLGCEPDYNAWTGGINPRPDPSENPTLRTASGHVHIGWLSNPTPDPFSESHFEDCCILGRQLDYYLGMPSLLWDPDPTRRKLYGNLGAFRPKPYGIEYRVPSNQWLKSRELTQFVWNAAYTAVHHLFANRSIVSKYGALVQDVFANPNPNWYSNPKAIEAYAYTGLALPSGLIKSS